MKGELNPAPLLTHSTKTLFMYTKHRCNNNNNNNNNYNNNNTNNDNNNNNNNNNNNSNSNVLYSTPIIKLKTTSTNFSDIFLYYIYNKI